MLFLASDESRYVTGLTMTVDAGRVRPVSSRGRYRHLFTPLRLGPVTVANRIVFSAHLTNYATDGLPTEQHAAYYAARAAGGAGLIITEEHSTHPTDWPYEKLIHGFHPEVVDGYRRITDAVHAHDVPIFAQINHNGGQASSMYSRPAGVGAEPGRPTPSSARSRRRSSPTRSPRSSTATPPWPPTAPPAASTGSSSSAPTRPSSAGSSPRPPTGGPTATAATLANRARLLLEIVDAVRSTIGPGRALGVRICGDELIEGGTGIDDAVAVARMVEATGQVDYVNTSIGVATATLYMIEASMQIPPGYAVYIPSAIRAAVDLPVVGVGRFKDPLQADRALADGVCDLVGVVRGQIADPDFAAKARSGHADRHPHLPLVQPGVRRAHGPQPVARLHREPADRARVGRSSPPPAPAHRGGGRRWPRRAPGGGHGGRAGAPGRPVRTARPARAARPTWRRSVPSRAEFFDIARNLDRRGADGGRGPAHRGRGHRGPVRAESPDAVIVATGARPSRPWWAGDDPRVVDVRDVLEGRAHPEGRVVVVDELGFHQATSTAELLADRGCTVEIVTNGMVVGQDLGITLDLETWNVKAHALGIVQAVDLVPMGVSRPGRRRATRRPRAPAPPHGTDQARRCDWVVCAVHQEAEDDLWRRPRRRPLRGPPRRRLPGSPAGPCRRHRGPPRGGVAVSGALPGRPGRPDRPGRGRWPWSSSAAAGSRWGRRGSGRGRGPGRGGRQRCGGRGPGAPGGHPGPLGRHRARVPARGARPGPRPRGGRPRPRRAPLLARRP